MSSYQPLMLLTTGSHFFTATMLTPRAKVVVMEFAKKFVKYSLQRSQGGRYTNTAMAVFAAATEDRTEFRFHINQMPGFIEHLEKNHITPNLYKREGKILVEAPTIVLEMKEGWNPREGQQETIDYVVSNDPTGSISKFIGSQTGFGKGFISIKSASILGKRTLIIVRPMYIEKWVDEISEMLEIETDEIMVVRGAQQLQALLVLSDQEGLDDTKVIILSNKTLQLWLKLYEKYRLEIIDLGYTCLPEDFCEMLKVGLRLIDEVHLDFHLNFKIDLYTHVERSLSLSATLLNNDPFLERMYEIAYPKKFRYDDGGMLSKHAHANALYYSLKRPEKMRWVEYGGTSYSHNALEKSIIKNPHSLKAYLELIDYTIKISFMKNTREKKKLLVFAGTIEMCTIIRDYIERIYPQYDVKRYVGEDPYDNLMSSDMCVSTLGSSGTAVDVPNLTTVIQTPAVDSVQSNAQAFGRLRDLKDDHKLEFLYFVCTDIPKHMEYDQRKQKMFEYRAKSFHQIKSHHSI